MAEELDEFGIPIRKSSNSAPQVDEFGIPMRKATTQPVTVKQRPTTDLSAIGRTPIDSEIPTPLTPKGREAEVKSQVVKKEKALKLSEDLGVAQASFDQAQGIGSVERIDEAIRSRPVDGLRDSSKDDGEFSKSAKNSFSNLATSLKGVIPRLDLASTALLEKSIGRESAKSFVNFLNYNPLAGESNLGNDFDTVQKAALEQLDQLATQIAPTEGVLENIKDFNLAGLAGATVDAITSLAATAIPSMASGGTLLASEMIGGSLYSANLAKAQSKGTTIEKLFESGEADIAVPAFLGSVGFALEKIGLKGVKNLINNNITGNIYKKALIIANDVNKEGMTEFLQVGLDEVNEALAKGATIEQASELAFNSMFSAKGFEAYAKGAVGAGAIGGIGRVGKVLLKSNKTEANNLEKEKEQAFQDIANDNIPVSVKETIIESLADTQEKLNKIVNKDIDEVESLSEAQRVKVDDLNTQIDEIEQSLEGVTEASKPILEAKLKTLNTELTDITNPKNQTTNEQINVNEENGEVQNGQENGQQEQTQGGGQSGNESGQNDVQIQEEVAPVVNEEITKSEEEVEIEIPKNLFEAIRGGEKTIKARKEQALKEFRALGKKANSGLDIERAAKALEITILAVADGTIKSAKALAKLLNISKVEDVQDIYDKANNLLTEYNNSKVAPSKVSIKQSIKASTTGGIQGEVNITNKQALKTQIQTLNRGIKEGLFQQKSSQKDLEVRKSDVRGQVTGFLKSFQNTDLFKGAKIPANYIATITTRLDKALSSKDFTTALMDFSEYLEKIIDDVEIDKKETTARAESKKIKAIANSSASKGQVVNNPILKRFANLGANPSKLTDLDKYNEIATRITEADRYNKTGNGVATQEASNKELENFIEKETEAQGVALDKRNKEIADLKEKVLKDEIQQLLDEAGIEGDVEDYYQSEVEYRDSAEQIRKEKESAEPKEELTDRLKRVIAENRKRLPKSIEGLSKGEIETLNALKGINLEDLTPTELKQINTAISNAVVNGDLITATMDVTQKYTQEVETAKWQETYKTKTAKGKGKIRQGTTGKYISLIPKTSRGDTRQLFVALSSARELGQSLYDSVMGGVISGQIKAQTRIDEAKGKILNIVGTKLKAVNRQRVGAMGYLLNFETDGRWADKQEAFEAKKQDLEDSLVLVEKEIERTKQNKSSLDLDKLKQEAKGLKATLDGIRKFETVEDFEKNFLTPDERKLYEFIKDTYENDKQAQKDYYRRLGVKFTDSENYFPITFGGVERVSITPTIEIGVDSYMGSSSLDNEGGFVAERTRKKGLPKTSRNGQERQMYIRTDALYNFNSEYARRVMDFETMPYRVRAKHFLSDKSLKNTINDGDRLDNMNNIGQKVVDDIADINGTSLFSKDADAMFIAVLDKIKQGFYANALGSVTQLASQTIPSVPVIISLTSFKSWGKAVQLQMSDVQRIRKLMQANNAKALERISSRKETELQSQLEKVKEEFDSGLIRRAKDYQRAVDKLSFFGIGAGDNINTTNAWTSGYIESLKKQGIIKSESEVTPEFLDAQIAKPNKEASNAGDATVSAVNATTNAVTKASGLKKRSTSAKAFDLLLGNLLKSFSTSFNFEARMAMRNILNGEGSSTDARFLGAYTASIFLIAPLVKLTIGYAIEGATAVSGAFEDEEEKKIKQAAEQRRLKELEIILTKEDIKKIDSMKISEPQKAKLKTELIKERMEIVKLKRKAIAYFTQGLSSVLLGSKPAYLEGLLEGGADRLWNLALVDQFQEGYNNKQKKVSALPSTLFFTSEDNLFGMGIADGLNKASTQIKTMYSSTLPLDEDIAERLTVARALNTFLQFGQGVPFAGDLKRYSDLSLRKLEELSKDGYYNIPKSYGVIKEAINEYDLEPIKPFKGKEVYLQDNTTLETKAVQLTPDEVKQINTDIGTEAVRLLGESKNPFGKTLKTFNLKKHNTTILNERLKDKVLFAKENVFKNRYKGFIILTETEFKEED